MLYLYQCCSSTKCTEAYSLIENLHMYKYNSLKHWEIIFLMLIFKDI